MPARALIRNILDVHVADRSADHARGAWLLAGTGSSTDDESNFQCQEQKKDNLIDTLTIGKPYEPDLKGKL